MNTSYEHAGNADQLRALQFDPAARCEACHFPVKEDQPGTHLQLVALPHDPALFCNDCIKLAKEAGDTDFTQLSYMMRDLLPETQAANAALIKELEKELEANEQN